MRQREWQRGREIERVAERAEEYEERMLQAKCIKLREFN